jgi:UDP-N-acetylmuramate dehydrogenase
MNHALSGLEFAAGIPGTLGGAIMMNAGAWGMEMADRVVSIEMVDPEGTALKTLDRKELAFSYRHLSARGILLAATLKLTNASAETIQKRVHQNLMQKKSAQPVSEASAGCFFKNPAQGKSAGELIELSGLKGLRINDAMVSCVHANYIVNVNAARCEDVLELKQHIQKTVFEKFQINLETEVRIEGEQ